MLYPNENGNIILTGGQFGWEWESYNDALTKANYAAVDFMHQTNLTEMLVSLIKEKTGCENVIVNVSDSYESENFSYIDHDSCGLVPKNREELENFIFNKNSWLFTGNDNDSASPEFYLVPTYTNEGIIKTKFLTELVIDDYNETVKFIVNPLDERGKIKNDDETTELIKDAIYYLTTDLYLTPDGILTKLNHSSYDTRNNYFQFDYYSSRDNKFLLDNKIYFICEGKFDKELKEINEGYDSYLKGRTKLFNEILERKNQDIIKFVNFTIKLI